MITLPELIPGRTYHRKDVVNYIAPQGDGGSDDYGLATSTFPRKGAEKERRDFKMMAAGAGRAIVLEYQELPFAYFASWLPFGRQRFSSPNDLERISIIRVLLESGGPAFPVWLDKHLINLDPPGVREGNHRLLAFAELEMPTVPVFLMKYEE